jgi:glycosyltransferase involved in cell wall biosynthesis
MRILSLIEADSVTGPAKILLEFATLGRDLAPPLGPLEITLATYRHPNAPRSDGFLEAAAAAGIPCEVLYQNHALDFSVSSSLRRLAERLQPDLIDTHSVKSHFWIASSGLARRYPWIAYHHGYTWPNLKQRVYNQFDRWSLQRARLVVTVTNAFIGQLENAGVSRERIRVVPSSIRADWADGVDRDLVANLRAEVAPTGAQIVLAVGRLSKEKGHADLIEALALMPARPGAERPHLVLLGDGYEREALQMMAATRNVSITLAGHIGAVAPYFAMADVFVLPSHSEGSPLVLVEAMAARLPIVATAVGGVPEMVDSGREALLVPAGQPPKLAEAIMHLLGHSEEAKRLGAAARERVEVQFSPEARVRTIGTIYRDFCR